MNDWQVVQLKNVTETVKSWDPSDEPEFSYVDISSIDNARCEIASVRRLKGSEAPSRARRPIQDGDVLFSNVRTYLRNVAQVEGIEGPAVASTGFTLLRPSASLDSRYLYHLVRSDMFIDEVTPEQTGTQYPATSDRVVRNQSISLPSLEEQQTIAAFIDAAETSRYSAALHLAATRRAIESFRRSILERAVSGRLTAEWRRDNSGVVSAGLAPTAPDDALDEVNIPDGWVVARIADVGDVRLGGTPSRKRPEFWDGNIKWVSSGEVANCRIASTRETISELGLSGSSAKLYPEGTVLIAMIGEGKTRGQAAILEVEAATNQNAAGILADRKYLNPEYLWRWALAQYETTRAAGTGGNQPALNKQRVADLIIPIPPLDEQAEIVRRLDQLLTQADCLALRVEAAAERVDASSQAVLAKAFSGELEA